MDDRETFDALHSFASIARELAGQHGMAPTTQRIVDLAVKVLGCEAAVLTRLSSHELVFVAGTDDDLTHAADAITHATGEGVSKYACQKRVTVVCNDIANDPRWVRAGQLGMVETKVRSVLAFHLQFENEDLGALTFYSESPGYFTPEICDFGSVYADHAAIALSKARGDEKTHNLELALASSREIGAAVGIVMHQLTLDQAHAFDVLKLASQNANRKLAELAHEVTEAGDIRPLREILSRERTPRQLP